VRKCFWTSSSRNTRLLLDLLRYSGPLPPCPVGGEVESYVADNLMLCGDAASQVIPLTGAGIHTGLVAGKIAGEEAAISALKGNVSAANLQRYRDRFDKLWGQRISNSLKALDSFERFSDNELNT